MGIIGNDKLLTLSSLVDLSKLVKTSTVSIPSDLLPKGFPFSIPYQNALEP